MPSIDDLSNYVQNNDVKGFLLTYLQLLDEGAALSVPTSLEDAKAREGWEEIVPSVTGGYTDEFISELTKLWLGTVNKQGGTITKTFAKELIAILENKPKPAPEPVEKKAIATPAHHPLAAGGKQTAAQPSSEPAAAETTQAQKVSYDEDTISSKISENYYSLEEAKETKLISKAELQNNIKLALNQKKHEVFLINYLSLIRHNEQIKVPVTSVLETIKSQWEHILMDQLDYQPETDFLKELAAKWFYLVNLKGLPNNKEKLEDFLFNLIANSKEQLVNPITGANKKENFITLLLKKIM